MAALLIAMTIAALVMTAAMPVWKQLNQREKEEELVFRGLQYVHAIQLYGRKFANTQPPSIDVLVQQKFLRKKYKDPITEDDFQIVMATAQAAGSNTPGGSTQQGASRPGAPTGGGASVGTSTPGQMTAPTGPQTSGRGTLPTGTGGPVGGIIGVTSKSKDKSIRLYNGRTHYNEWVFMYQPQTLPGANTPGGVMPGVGGNNPRGNSAPIPGGAGPFGGRGRDGRGGGRGGGPGGNRGPGLPSGPGFPGPGSTTPQPGRGRL